MTRDEALRAMIGIINPTCVNPGYRGTLEPAERWAARRDRQINVALDKAEAIWALFNPADRSPGVRAKSEQGTPATDQSNTPSPQAERDQTP